MHASKFGRIFVGETEWFRRVSTGKFALCAMSLVKLTPAEVNFTNILRAPFAPIFLRQRIANLKCSHKKASRETFNEKAARKMLAKLTPAGVERESEGKKLGTLKTAENKRVE